jgi:protoheme IX farnesyltransferase
MSADAPVRTKSLPEQTAGDWSAALAALAIARGGDYLALAKPRISAMVLITVTVGYALGCGDAWNTVRLLHALIGIALAAAGSSAFNQYLERWTDARMRRTAERPLPAGRLHPREVLAFGALGTAGGVLYLLLTVNAGVAALTLLTVLLYGAVYTPLKKRTCLCTAVGAVPGALPPVLGWAASGAALDVRAFVLFGVLFLWQFPHFLAIAWLYRDQYSSAGLRMLPAANRPRVVGLMATGYAVVLLPVSVMAAEFGLAGKLYLVTAIALGAGYAYAALRFAMCESRQTARSLLYSSLIYLPTLLVAMTFDNWRLLQ